MKDLACDLENLQAQGLWRSLVYSEGRQDFCSNDYLGLSKSPVIRQVLLDALQSGLPLAATGSRLLGGNLKWHEEHEDFLATTFRSPAALCFSSGFMANLGVLSAFDDEQTHFFSDELNHASLIDGQRLSGAQKSRFRHNDMNDLELLLKKSGRKRKIIVTESVFSMDGDLSPLSEIFELAANFGAWLVVDEAHATGVFGSKGLGRLEGTSRTDVPLIQIHTGGKALASPGAFVLCSKEVRDYLINKSRPFIFSTALSPLVLLQTQAALREVLKAPEQGPELLRKAHVFREHLRDFFPSGASQSQIVPIILGSNERVMRTAHALQELGYDIRGVRAPAVARGTERLRLCLKSTHTETEILSLAEILKREVNDV